MTTINKTDLENASLDVKSIDQFVNGDADLNGTGIVTSRLGTTYRTIKKITADIEDVETDAALSAISAASSAGQADDSRELCDIAVTLAQKFAGEDEDVTVLPGLFSSMHWALKSESYSLNYPYMYGNGGYLLKGYVRGSVENFTDTGVGDVPSKVTTTVSTYIPDDPYLGECLQTVLTGTAAQQLFYTKDLVKVLPKRFYRVSSVFYIPTLPGDGSTYVNSVVSAMDSSFAFSGFFLSNPSMAISDNDLHMISIVVSLEEAEGSQQLPANTKYIRPGLKKNVTDDSGCTVRANGVFVEDITDEFTKESPAKYAEDNPHAYGYGGYLVRGFVKEDLRHFTDEADGSPNTRPPCTKCTYVASDSVLRGEAVQCVVGTGVEYVTNTKDVVTVELDRVYKISSSMYVKVAPADGSVAIRISIAWLDANYDLIDFDNTPLPISFPGVDSPVTGVSHISTAPGHDLDIPANAVYFRPGIRKVSSETSTCTIVVKSILVEDVTELVALEARLTA